MLGPPLLRGDLLLDLWVPEGPAGVAGGLGARGGTGVEVSLLLSGDLELSDLLIFCGSSLDCLFFLDLLSSLFRMIGETAGTLALLGTFLGGLTFFGGVTVVTL